MTCWSYFPVIFLNTFPLSKDAKLSSVCAVPVDDWFPLAKDAGTKVPQCAWPNLEGGATVEKTASVKSERFHHRYTAAPLLSHLPQYTWVVKKRVWSRLRKYFFHVSEIQTFRRCFPKCGSPSQNLTHVSVFGFRRIVTDVRHAFFWSLRSRRFFLFLLLFFFAPCFSFVLRKVRDQTRKPWGGGERKVIFYFFLLAPSLMVFSFDLCLAFARCILLT